jgi:hypothetical protein
MHEDPITLYVALDKAGTARGTLYLGKFLHATNFPAPLTLYVFLYVRNSCLEIIFIFLQEFPFLCFYIF